jgi:hypothetical protein
MHGESVLDGGAGGPQSLSCDLAPEDPLKRGIGLASAVEVDLELFEFEQVQELSD